MPRAAIPFRTATLAPLAFVLAACGGAEPPATPAAEAQPVAAAADAIYTGGKVYTMESATPWAEAIAVREGRIVAVGTNAEVEALAGPATERVGLEGRMVMPGINDMHAHLSQAGTKELFECGFPFTLGVEEIVAKVRECTARVPAGEWLRGGQWAMPLLDGAVKPSRALLDAAAPEHPVFLIDSTVHAAWLNSAALAKLGIDDATPDPTGGVIARDATGRATGILYDNAMYGSIAKLPVYSTEQMMEALAWSVAQFNRVGVTTIRDAMVDRTALAGYAALDRAGRLDANIATSLAWRMLWAGPQAQLEQVIADRAASASANVHVDFGKIMLDGIPPSRTAAVLDPYLPDAAYPADHRGYLTQTPESLKEDLVKLDAMGISVKMHATGDRSARVALDAVEAARKANGASGLWHEVSHAEMIHPEDLDRFAPLGVVAEMSPILWYPSPLHTMMENALGLERTQRFWPVKSLLDRGALLDYGSDWPSVVPSANPWPGVEAMVTRRDPYTDAETALAPGEAIDLATALRIFTINGARTIRLDGQTGSLAKGKQADFIVLDRNLFEVAPEAIGETQVLRTVVRGRTVFSQ